MNQHIAPNTLDNKRQREAAREKNSYSAEDTAANTLAALQTIMPRKLLDEMVNKASMAAHHADIMAMQAGVHDTAGMLRSVDLFLQFARDVSAAQRSYLGKTKAPAKAEPQ